ncbi:unnamed protein product [Trifolium pratense]|uniref:Uncharacterized protein n=1 Tax=Trifolium pratense TaxID=57577 RepID=A0ACB0K062_TRIPR|nr:unnamed protein product [Trifolium pratense]
MSSIYKSEINLSKIDSQQHHHRVDLLYFQILGFNLVQFSDLGILGFSNFVLILSCFYGFVVVVEKEMVGCWCGWVF